LKLCNFPITIFITPCVFPYGTAIKALTQKVCFKQNVLVYETARKGVFGEQGTLPSLTACPQERGLEDWEAAGPGLGKRKNMGEEIGLG
jgi:hypothetical protein